MKIVSQPKDELPSRGEGRDECCVLLSSLCLQSRSPTPGSGSGRSAPFLTGAQYYRTDRNEVDTAIPLPVGAPHRPASPLSAVGLVQSGGFCEVARHESRGEARSRPH